MTVPDLALLRRSLRSSLVCDALDALGVRTAAIAPPVVALEPSTVMVGRAFPVRTCVVEEPFDPPYQGLLRALDALSADDVYVVSANGRADVALWGELLTTAALAARAAGVLCDGAVRDSADIRRMAFPCFCRGTMPYDINGRLEVVEHGVPIAFGGLTIEPGQLVVADDDGVVVVPREVEEDAIRAALEKAQSENAFRDAVAGGMKPSEAYRRHRVL